MRYIHSQLKSSKSRHLTVLQQVKESIPVSRFDRKAEALEELVTKADLLLANSHPTEAELNAMVENLSLGHKSLDLNCGRAASELLQAVADLREADQDPEEEEEGAKVNKDNLYLDHLVANFQSRLSHLLASERNILGEVKVKAEFSVEQLDELSRRHRRYTSEALAVLKLLGEKVDMALREKQSRVSDHLPRTTPDLNLGRESSLSGQSRRRRCFAEEGLTGDSFIKIFSSPAPSSCNVLAGGFSGEESSPSNFRKRRKICFDVDEG